MIGLAFFAFYMLMGLISVLLVIFAGKTSGSARAMSIACVTLCVALSGFVTSLALVDSGNWSRPIGDPLPVRADAGGKNPVAETVREKTGPKASAKNEIIPQSLPDEAPPDAASINLAIRAAKRRAEADRELSRFRGQDFPEPPRRDLPEDPENEVRAWLDNGEASWPVTATP